MNDFTKEELQIIRYLINNLDEKMLTWSDSVILVQSKIQSMIDNYCEHEHKLIGVDPATDEGICVYCEKCKKVFGDIY